MAGWIAVQRDVDIIYDLENSPLLIRTNSEVGSDERMNLWFHTAGGETAGGVALKFMSPQHYWIHFCTFWTNLPTALPTQTNKIWTITLSKISGIRLSIHCNDKEVLNIVMSSTTCSDNRWSEKWSRDMKKIHFSSKWDTASDFYIPGKY